jgi:hypothetical protein
MIVVVVVVVAVVVVVVTVMMFAASVVTVNPVMAVFTPMPGNPDHFPVAIPIACAMGVVRTIANLDPDICGSEDRRQRQASYERYNKQKFFLRHITN